MKKGFTIVEIIISITIVLTFGVSFIFFVVKTKNNNIESITNKILEAANLYVKTEVDDQGELYIDRVLSNAKGVQISLNNLVEKGYIENSLKENVYDAIGNPAVGEDYFIMFLKGSGTENNYCDDGSTVILASWTIEKDKDIFLCDNTLETSKNTLYNLITNLPSYSDCTQQKVFVTPHADMEVGVTYSDRFSGLCYFHGYDLIDPNSDGTVDDIWYFKGKNVNNYLTIYGLNRTFRIVRTTENNGVKIIDNSVISDADIYSGNFSFLSSFDSSKLYTPLLDEYDDFEKSVLDEYIDKDYKWCTSSNTLEQDSPLSFKCPTEKNFESDFGILNIFEYKNISSLAPYSDDDNKIYLYNYLLTYSSCDETSEIAFGYRDGNFTTTRAVVPNLWRGSCNESSNRINIRPAFVIKGDSIVASGNGTAEQPYSIISQATIDEINKGI